MLVRILIVVAVLIAAVLVFAATKPGTFRIERSRIIQASPEKIFPLINDLHNWTRWQPQEEEDRNTERSYSGAETGVGAVLEWSGHGSTGKGRMEIIESVPPKTLSVKVDWVKPFGVRNINDFALEPTGTSTTVTWSMHGRNLYIMKLMSVFANMDRVMGKHFDNGLNNLKQAAEK